MKLDKSTKKQLLFISDTIKHVAKCKHSHLPDKIGGLQVSISLIKMEIVKLKKIRDKTKGE